MPTLYRLNCVAVDPSRPRLAFGGNERIVSLVDLHDVAEGNLAARTQAVVGGAEGAAPSATSSLATGGSA